MSALHLALSYAELGWRVLPVKPLSDPNAKHPYIKMWEQRSTNDVDQLTAWWNAYPDAIPAVHTGGSGLVVFDLEGEGKAHTGAPESNAKALGLPDHGRTLTVRTPSGGAHWYYEGYADGKHKLYVDGDFVGDMQAANSYVIPAGVPGYDEQTPGPIAQLPAELKDVGRKARNATGAALPTEVGQGQRNDHLASVAGTLWNHMRDADQLYTALAVENDTVCKPPVDDRELRQIVDSVNRYDRKDVRPGAATHSSIADFAADAPERQVDDSLFAVLMDDDINDLPPVEWICHRLIQANEGTVIVGKRGAAKTFLVLNIAMHITSSPDFYGRELANSPVLYFALENVYAMRDRRRAWEALYGKTSGFGIVENKVIHKDNGPITVHQTDKIIRTAQATGAKVVVIDTQSRWTPGMQENDGKDMSKVVGAVDAMCRAGLTPIIVHHEGKGAGLGARGHSSLEAGFIGILSIAKDKEDENLRYLTVQKQNNGPEGEVMPFRFKFPGITDDNGDEVPVLAWSEFGQRPLNKDERDWLRLEPYITDAPQSTNTIAAVSPFGGDKTTRLLEWAKKQGRVIETPGPRSARMWHVPAIDDVAQVRDAA